MANMCNYSFVINLALRRNPSNTLTSGNGRIRKRYFGCNAALLGFASFRKDQQKKGIRRCALRERGGKELRILCWASGLIRLTVEARRLHETHPRQTRIKPIFLSHFISTKVWLWFERFVVNVFPLPGDMIQVGLRRFFTWMANRLANSHQLQTKSCNPRCTNGQNQGDL